MMTVEGDRRGRDYSAIGLGGWEGVAQELSGVSIPVQEEKIGPAALARVTEDWGAQDVLDTLKASFARGMWVDVSETAARA